MPEKQPLLPRSTKKKLKKCSPVLVIHGGAGIFDKSKYANTKSISGAYLIEYD